MSDGHFNRCLLPHDPFRDGMRAGKAQLRAKAVETFRQFIDAHFPTWNEEQRQQALETFRATLNG